MLKSLPVFLAAFSLTACPPVEPSEPTPAETSSSSSTEAPTTGVHDTTMVMDTTSTSTTTGEGTTGEGTTGEPSDTDVETTSVPTSFLCCYNKPEVTCAQGSCTTFGYCPVECDPRVTNDCGSPDWATCQEVDGRSLCVMTEMSSCLTETAMEGGSGSSGECEDCPTTA